MPSHYGSLSKRAKAMTPKKKNSPKKKMGEVEIGKEKIPIKEGALSKQLGIEEEKNIPMSLLKKLSKVDVGEEFDHKGKKMKMTNQLKKRITLAITLKNMKKK